MKTKVILDPNKEDFYRYRVEANGKTVGYVGHTYRMEQGWYFQNHVLGVYGTARTQRQAIADLLSVPVVIKECKA